MTIVVARHEKISDRFYLVALAQGLVVTMKQMLRSLFGKGIVTKE
jgi:hypothetical protein